MIGLGVASFGHINRVHVQNRDTWEAYAAAVDNGEIPLSRAYRPTDEERMIREFILQMKSGSVRPSYFQEKYGVNVLDRFREPLQSLTAASYLREAGPSLIALSREGLLRVDALLKRFFKPEHAAVRYT